VLAVFPGNDLMCGSEGAFMENETVGTMKNKIAIITGGSRGIGRNTAVNLARRGVDVIFTYRSNQVEADSLIREIEAIRSRAAGFRLDAGDTRSFEGFVALVREALQGWGRERFDYLVNNAGNSQHINFEQRRRRTLMRWSTSTSKASTF
jgi:NAD(P)-dependent dehydrogenase (short-subunit alcohol dehydrogenase family)